MTPVRKRKKYIKTNSRTDEVRTRSHPRINKMALVFFVVQKAYPAKMTSTEVQVELAKDGIDMTINSIQVCLRILSGRNTRVVKRLRRNELKFSSRGGVHSYTFNPAGTIKIKPVALSYSRNDLVTEATFV